MAKFSIVIPVYNVAPYLRQCMDSVLNQTFRDIEIICVNDCSTDTSLSILEEYAKKDTRIVIIDKKNNDGLGITRNVGERAAKGDYVLFLDSDDYIALNLCEKLLNKFELCDADAIYYNSASFQDNNPSIFSDYHRLGDMSQLLPATGSFVAAENFELLTKLSCTVWYKCYRRSFLAEHNIYCSEDRCLEDSFFTVNFLLANPKVSYIDEILHFYRIRPNSLNKNMDTKVDIVFDVYEKSLNSILNSSLDIKDKITFVRSRVKWLLYWTYNSVSKRCRKDIQEKRKQYCRQILSLFPVEDIQSAKFPERFWRELFMVRKCGVSFWKDYSAGFLKYKFKFLIFKISFKAKEKYAKN